MSQPGAAADRILAAWRVLGTVPDPEVPAVSVCELGIVRDVHATDDGALRVVLTPTYSGCPATEAIADAVRSALVDAGLGAISIEHRLAPAWTTDWISADGRRKLREAGIAPPTFDAGSGDPAAMPIRLHLHVVPCPRCGSRSTERLSAFGSTACKALHRCRACLEPFEYFKPF